MFTTMAHQDKDEDFRTLHEACIDKYGYNSKYWTIENKRLKVHCRLVVEVERHARWIAKMEEQIMLSQMGTIIDKMVTPDEEIYVLRIGDMDEEKVITFKTPSILNFHIGDEVIYKDGTMLKLIRGGSNSRAA